MTAAQIFGLIAGIGMLAAGLWTLWGRRNDARRVELPGYGRLSEPTRLLVGVALLIVGYHCAVWSVPDRLAPLKVPRERWWLLTGGIAVALAAGAAADQFERRKET